MNFLESLIAEWLEYNGYFVRRNIKVGRLQHGGWEGELDIIALNPSTHKLVHYECSSDQWTIKKRDEVFARKFALGEKHISAIFPEMLLPPLEQKILHAYASKVQTTMGGVEVIRLQDFMVELVNNLGQKNPLNEAVAEQYPLLRTLQWAAISIKKS